MIVIAINNMKGLEILLAGKKKIMPTTREIFKMNNSTNGLNDFQIHTLS